MTERVIARLFADWLKTVDQRRALIETMLPVFVNALRWQLANSPYSTDMDLSFIAARYALDIWPGFFDAKWDRTLQKMREEGHNIWAWGSARSAAV